MSFKQADIPGGAPNVPPPFEPIVPDNKPHWMETLGDKIGDIPLCQLPIPGSHDSGTYGMSESAETQSLTIKEQLNLGIRFFDLRPCVDNGNYWVAHTFMSSNKLASWPLNLTEPSIFLELRQFLQANPKEVVILKFQSFSSKGGQDFNSEDHKHFRELLNDFLPLVPPSPVSSVTLNSIYARQPRAQAPQGEPSYGGVIVFYQLTSESKPTASEPAGDPSSWHNFWPYLTEGEQRDRTDYIKLWDPYWNDYYWWLGDQDPSSWAKHWIPYNEENLKWWAAMTSTRFFITQAQMEVGGADMKVSLRKSAELNNPKNVALFKGWMQNGLRADASRPLRPNILTMDFVQHGDLCQEILDFFGSMSPDRVAQEYPFYNGFIDASDFALKFGANQNQYLAVSGDGWVVATGDKSAALRFRLYPAKPEKPFSSSFNMHYQVVGGAWDKYYLSMDSSYCLKLYASSSEAVWQQSGQGLFSLYSHGYLPNSNDGAYIYVTAESSVAAQVTQDWTAGTGSAEGQQT